MSSCAQSCVTSRNAFPSLSATCQVPPHLSESRGRCQVLSGVVSACIPLSCQALSGVVSACIPQSCQVLSSLSMSCGTPRQAYPRRVMTCQTSPRLAKSRQVLPNRAKSFLSRTLFAPFYPLPETIHRAYAGPFYGPLCLFCAFFDA